MVVRIMVKGCTPNVAVAAILPQMELRSLGIRGQQKGLLKGKFGYEYILVSQHDCVWSS